MLGLVAGSLVDYHSFDRVAQVFVRGAPPGNLLVKGMREASSIKHGHIPTQIRAVCSERMSRNIEMDVSAPFAYS